MVEREPGRYLITQRSKAATLPLLWEFPGGRVEAGESDEAALCRELKERLALAVEVLELVMATTHAYPAYDVELHVFRCRPADPAQDPSHAKIHDHRWVTLEEMSAYEFPGADAQTIAKLLELDG